MTRARARVLQALYAWDLRGEQQLERVATQIWDDLSVSPDERRLYGHHAYRLAVGLTRNAQDAEEVVQDAAWAVARKIDTFRGDSAFGSWS